jgi:hypothetical protein
MAIFISTMLALFWPKGTLDGVMVEGLALHPQQLLFLVVWIYCIIVWFIQDVLKVLTYKIMHHFNLFDINCSEAREVLRAQLERDPSSAPRASLVNSAESEKHRKSGGLHRTGTRAAVHH